MARRKRVGGLRVCACYPPDDVGAMPVLRLEHETDYLRERNWECVRLVECGPGEVVVPRTALAVVRAAVDVLESLGDAEGPSIYALRRAVEKHQKARKR